MATKFTGDRGRAFAEASACAQGYGAARRRDRWRDVTDSKKRKGTAVDAPALRKEPKRTKALRNQVRMRIRLCFFAWKPQPPMDTNS